LSSGKKGNGVYISRKICYIFWQSNTLTKDDSMKNSLSIVISAYNEEGNVKELHRQLKKVIADLPLREVELIFVNDGSKDKTLAEISALQKDDPSVKIVNFVRNMGHEVAMRAGMDHASGDAVLFMDADLQHPPSHIPEMVRLWQDGKDIVLTRRTDNVATSRLYKLASGAFYKVLNFLSDVKVPKNTPDFRLLDREYVEYFKSFGERDIMFRGLLSLAVSLDSDRVATIDFAAPARLHGETKYGFGWRSVKLAVDSILQFSTKPLYLSLWLAILSGGAAVILAMYVIIERYFLKNPTPGYATTVTAVMMMGAVNLFVLTIIGAYIGKIHMETKKRPLYLAEFITVEQGKRKIRSSASKNNQCG